MMKKTIRQGVSLVLGMILSSALAVAQTVSGPPDTVRGEILKIDGSSYFVKDRSGKEVTLQVDSQTLMIDGLPLKAGDTIMADVTAKGRATYILTAPPLSGGNEKNAASPPSAETPPPVLLVPHP
jgi:hypothetical protein